MDIERDEKRVHLYAPQVFLGTKAEIQSSDEDSLVFVGDTEMLTITFPTYRTERGAGIGEATVRLCDDAIEALNTIRSAALKRAAAEADAVAAS